MKTGWEFLALVIIGVMLAELIFLRPATEAHSDTSISNEDTEDYQDPIHAFMKNKGYIT